MSTIDFSKIRVGDRVTVRALVAESDDNEGYPIRLHGGSWIKRENIVAHTPKPREFKPGDRVMCGTYGPLTIAAIDAGDVWLKTPTGHFTADVSDLRHADESE